ncbi:MAG: TatD family hydrolase [Deltaproteobacteria bacterium]|nr:TatD family hydrolase [Deltaproteobacteria bacterium]
MFDSHCHLDDAAFDHDREQAWGRAVSTGLVGALVAAVRPDRWAHTLAAATGPRVAALGVHPHALASLSDTEIVSSLDALPALRTQHPERVVAVGEVGFDGAMDLSLASHARQAQVFAWHAEVACALKLPLVVHVFRAHEQALAVLQTLRLPSPAGVIHSFSGGPELVARYEALGFFLSFAGGITRARARKPVAAARLVSPDRLLAETDAPDQTPTGVPEGVTRCEPAHLSLVVRALAEACEVSVESMAERTTRNARALFALA